MRVRRSHKLRNHFKDVANVEFALPLLKVQRWHRSHLRAVLVERDKENLLKGVGTYNAGEVVHDGGDVRGALAEHLTYPFAGDVASSVPE